MLGIGLMLFCLRGLTDRLAWSDALLKPMFWLLNIGLAMMVFMALVPAGIYQAWASVSRGMWFARSPAVIHSAFMEDMVWLRVPGDVVFAVGTLFLALFVLRVMRGPARTVEVPIEIAGRPAARAARTARTTTKA
jgi:nitric oxide reductase subunit B